MRRGTRLLISASVLVVMIGAIFFAGKPQPSSGQRMSDIPNNRKPACSIFCGDGTMNYVVLANPPACWGGPLPAGDAGDYFKDVSKADENAICENLESTGRPGSSCPTFKNLMAECKRREKPPGNEKDPPDAKCKPDKKRRCQNLLKAMKDFSYFDKLNVPIDGPFASLTKSDLKKLEEFRALMNKIRDDFCDAPKVNGPDNLEVVHWRMDGNVLDVIHEIDSFSNAIKDQTENNPRISLLLWIQTDLEIIEETCKRS